MTRRNDWLIHQLPVGMVEDDFLVQFLRIFQGVSDTMLHQVDTLPHMFDPNVAPDAMVRTMGEWLGLFIDSSLPDALQRRIVNVYSSMVRWRGTAYGVRQLLEMVSGAPATVEDNGGVYLEGESPPGPPHVRLTAQSLGWATEEDLLSFVRYELPASVTFELIVAGRTVWPPDTLAVTPARDVPTSDLALLATPAMSLMTGQGAGVPLDVDPADEGLADGRGNEDV